MPKARRNGASLISTRIRSTNHPYECPTPPRHRSRWHQDRRYPWTAIRRGDRTIAIFVDLLNPQVIVLGSLFVRARHHLEPALLRELHAEALPELVAACRVVPAELGESIGDLQALAAAMESPV